MTKTKICINNAKFFGYHGVLEYEKEFGNEFEVDIKMICNIESLQENDNLELTVDYLKVYNHVKEIFLGNKFNLIETANQIIGNSILKNFDKVESVKVSIRKPNAPLGIIDSVEVTSEYKRK